MQIITTPLILRLMRVPQRRCPTSKPKIKYWFSWTPIFPHTCCDDQGAFDELLYGIQIIAEGKGFGGLYTKSLSLLSLCWLKSTVSSWNEGSRERKKVEADHVSTNRLITQTDGQRWQRSSFCPSFLELCTNLLLYEPVRLVFWLNNSRMAAGERNGLKLAVADCNPRMWWANMRL